MQQEILAFIRQNPVAHLATVAEGAPRVRAMMPFRVDATGIYLGTLRGKDLYRQLERTPRAELCFTDPVTNRMLRIHGLVHELEDETVRRDMLAVFPFMLPVAEGEGLEELRVFLMERGEYRWWDATTGMDRSPWLAFSVTAPG